MSTEDHKMINLQLFHIRKCVPGKPRVPLAFKPAPETQCSCTAKTILFILN